MPDSKSAICVITCFLLLSPFQKADAQIIVDSNTVILRFDTNDWGHKFEYKRIFKNALPTDSILQSEIEQINTIVYDCVEGYNADPSYGQEIILSKYKRQLVAAINGKGEKIVWVNYFDLPLGYGRDWKKEIMLWSDGGERFFQLIINLSTKKFEFNVNGKG